MKLGTFFFFFFGRGWGGTFSKQQFYFSASQVQMCLKAWIPQRRERNDASKLCCIECWEWAAHKRMDRRCLFPISITTLTAWSRGMEDFSPAWPYLMAARRIQKSEPLHGDPAAAGAAGVDPSASASLLLSSRCNLLLFLSL